MEYRKLGETDLNVSVVGFGCWAAGAKGWGKVDDNESIAAMQRAIDLGINLFDTADEYGWGHSEEILGKAIKGRRDGLVIATKVGRTVDETGKYGLDASRKHIFEAVEGSLKRLQIDCIDLYQIHAPDPDTPHEETLRAMEDLVKQGKIRYFGCSNYTAEQLEESLKYGRFDTLQPPYNLFQRQIERDILPLCRRENIGVLSYGTLCKGLLTGKFTPDTTFPEDDNRSRSPMFQGERFRRNLAIVEKLKKIAAEYGKTVGQLAISWVINQPGITVALVGAKRPSQVEENVGGAGWKISKEHLEEIDRIMAEA